MSSKANMTRKERSSKIDDRPVSTGTPHSCIKLTKIQPSKFHVGDEVYIIIRDYRGYLQRRGPYLIAQVLGGGKYILCHSNGAVAEGGQAIDEKHLVAA